MVTVINAYLKAITNRQTERRTDRATTEQRQWVEEKMNLKRDHRQRRQVSRGGAEKRGETEKEIMR